jgi:hypothetical protein
MNARGQYLAWLRKTSPAIYTAALRKVSGNVRGVGGLNDDLLARMSRTSTGFGFLGDDTADLQTITVTADAPSDTSDLSTLVLDSGSLSPMDTQAIQAAAILPTITNMPGVEPVSSTSTSVFGQVAQAVASVVAAGMQASSQSNLIKLNTQRATQGLPPVNANGVPISTGFFTPSANPTLARMEASIAGVATSPILWIAGLGLAALLLLRSKRA